MDPNGCGDVTAPDVDNDALMVAAAVANCGWTVGDDPDI